MPGAPNFVTITLAPGRYELVCDLSGHYAAGMCTQLAVTWCRVEARNVNRTLRHFPLLRYGARKCRPHQRAMWSVLTRLKATADHAYPFPHPYQAQPTGSFPRPRGLQHALAVVRDGELDGVAEAQVNPDVLGLGMANDVV